MKHRRMQIVNGAYLFCRGISKFIRSPVDSTATDSGTRKPHRHRFIVVIASNRTFVLLRHGSAPKLAAPNDQGIFEHTPPL